VAKLFDTRDGRLLRAMEQAPHVIWRNLRNNKRVVLFVVAVVLFLGILQNMLAGDLLRLDYYAYRIFVVRMRRAWLTPIMQS
jgi:undecaprenyl-diphosphatase